MNCYRSTEVSPLTADLEGAVQVADPEAGREALDGLAAWRAARSQGDVDAALAGLTEAARSGTNLMEPTLVAARAGATTGEWTAALREVFGEFRPPTGVSGAASAADAGNELATLRAHVRRTGEQLGGRLRLLVGKPGLDGHSNGAEQVAVRARDAGFEVVYQGIRLTPEQIVAAAVAEDVHCVGLSILSGSHMELVPAVLDGLREHGIGDVPVVVGGIIPPGDAATLTGLGVAAVFTPKDFRLTDVISGVLATIRTANGLDSQVLARFPDASSGDHTFVEDAARTQPTSS